MNDPKVEAARREAATARARVLGAAHDVQARLAPSSLASEAVERAKRRGEALADDTAAVVRKQPVAVGAAAGGVGALLGLGLFVRHRRRKAVKRSKNGDGE